MVEAFKTMNFMVLLPIMLGGIVCLFSFSALVDRLFQKAYAGLFHFVAGIVLASTVMIIPMNYNYMSIGTLVCIGTMIIGICLGLWMSKLEAKYK
jgi:putative membrane protein